MEGLYYFILQVIHIAILIYGIKLAISKDKKTKKTGKIILWIFLGIPTVIVIVGTIAFILFFMTCFGVIKW